MSISSSLNAGVAGLSANATRLATISDNIANSGTYGYKRVSTDFENFVINQARGAGHILRRRCAGINDAAYRRTRGACCHQQCARPCGVGARHAAGDVGGFAEFNFSGGGAAVDDDDNGVVPARCRWCVADGIRPRAARLARQCRRLDPGAAARYDFRPATGDHQRQPDGRRSDDNDEPRRQPARDRDRGRGGRARLCRCRSNISAISARPIRSTSPSRRSVPATGASNTWTMEIRDSAQAGALIGEYTLVFDDTRANGGTLASVTTVSGGAYDPADRGTGADGCGAGR